MLDEVARARELDQFASGHDAQLSFTLRARQHRLEPRLCAATARHGWALSPGAIPGRMVLPAQRSRAHAPMPGLAFDTQAAMAEDPEQTAHSRTHAVSLDVPQVAAREQPFVRMREAALALADGDGRRDHRRQRPA